MTDKKRYNKSSKKESLVVTNTKGIVNIPNRKKVLIFKAISIMIPIFLIIFAEIILRLNDYGGYPSFIKEIGNLPTGEKLCIVEPAASKPYFYNNPTRPGYTEQNSFVMPKPANTIRIFLIGESAAKGYPQPKNLSMSSFLQEMLSNIKPDKNIEIINLGTTAVASFPIIYIVRDALRYSPDLFISYTGNNEFFGAYGTASINSTGIFPPWMLPALRWANGLAIVQGIYKLIGNDEEEKRSLMEQMIGQAIIDPDDSMREDAVENLKYNLNKIAEEVKSSGSQLLLCTTASNETGLEPLGIDNIEFLSENDKNKLNQLWNEGKNLISNNPNIATEKLLSALIFAPKHAGINFALAKAYAKMGDNTNAEKYFLNAKNFDTMPWRPTDKLESAIVEVAKKNEVLLCDIAKSFRKRSNKISDWELIDDHVHLSVKGQAVAACLMLQSISKLSGELSFEVEKVNQLPDWKYYSEKLGFNIYDEYRVNHTLRVLFGIPFMKSSNEEAYNRFNNFVETAEKKMSPAVLQTCLEWQTNKPHAGGLRPITGMVARVMIRENRLKEALMLYEIAKKQVPEYTSWYLEYLYFELALKEQISGFLTEKEQNIAQEGIMQGRFLLEHGFSETGLTERYVGRLFQLRGEWKEAIPFLLAAKPKMGNEDLVAIDHALVMSYINIGNKNNAIEILEYGVRFGGKFSQTYKNILLNLQKKKSL